MSVAQNTASGIIKSVLIQLEQRLDIKVLMAAEAGSRAWGFASPDSDYDVRFIYCRPVDRYLTVNKRRDVLDINTPELTEVLRDLGIDTDIMDFAGWDADKAVYQMSKSNPQVLEWTNSPIIYRPNAHLVALAEKMYNPIPVMHHYRSMAKGNFREYLQGDE
ncbi:nucleotidyltransferase domain-containing protein, partial [Yersinia enterocolitica]